ncbi:MAG: 30S ribosomal protein S2 [Candidatus Moeniiplasma glomeromycotorum]|nr:30S ribosomal protein S2 [Candidatus Moeniiplasma glomeromycotorum]MCE8162201.1 30S ribosomal protein S2 [Candidatus Moeniiplasma glomeromycotorum]MCE8166143.1 30S ribosomal protein S2 [Candidatus Moeniiplasma glomeromycotorum]MCE8166600.1 30S ribosomal protein S2 [Candidatus Moeniiplasma glomeromycotorum]
MLNLEFDRNELVQIGIHRGGKSWKWNPAMRPFVYKKKWKTYFFDLEKIIQQCQGVNVYINSLIQEKKKILFVATKNSIREIVKEEAVRCGMPYLVNKWKGGFLTNFEQIKKKIDWLRKLKRYVGSENFQKLTAKKKVELEKARNKLNRIYEGVLDLSATPEVLFIIGLQKERTALREAKNDNIAIPVIAVCNTDCNPKWVDYVLPGNDQEAKSVKFFTSLVAEAIIKAKGGQVSEEKVEKEEKLETEKE